MKICLPALLAFLFVSTPAHCALTATTAASTATAAGAPTQAIKNLVSEAQAYKDENAPELSKEEKTGRLEAKNRISAILDLSEMAHQILEPRWEKMKPAEREKYASLLSGLVEKIGYPQIEKFFNSDIVITYTGEKPLKNGDASVFTDIFYKDEDLTLTTEFRLHKKPSGWSVYNVITDGDSLLLIYRNQHMSIIKDKGFPELLRLMEKKLDAD